MRSSGKPALWVILGPTSSGKSAFAIRLARRIGGEIISFDAMQVYQGLPRLTHQPTCKAREGIPHHLMGFLPASRSFTAAQFSKEAKSVIQTILQRKKIPILVGGSGFYLKALLEGYHAPVKGNLSLRNKYRSLLSQKGSGHLYERLRMIDPQRAKAIHPNDAYRIIRALEIFELTGIKPSAFSGGGGLSQAFRVKKIGLRLPRERLIEKINRRVESMIRQGAIAEVRRIQGRRISPTARRIIGLGELSNYVKGKRTLEEALLEVKKATRRYAKRQETWFRKEKKVRWLGPDAARRFFRLT